MKKIMMLAIITACVSCGDSKKENEATTETPVSNIRCDSVETVNIDSITGAQTFFKTWKCDSTVEAK